MSSSGPAQSKKERDLDSLLRHIRGVRSLLTEAKSEGSTSRTRMLEKVKLAQVSTRGMSNGDEGTELTLLYLSRRLRKLETTSTTSSATLSTLSMLLLRQLHFKKS